MSRSVPHRALILAAVVTFGMVCGLLKTTIRSYRASPTTNMRWDTIPYAYYEPNKKRLKAVSVDGDMDRYRLRGKLSRTAPTNRSPAPCSFM